MSTQTQIESFDVKSSDKEKSFAEVVFNLPLKKAFTYNIPPNLLGKVLVGMRRYLNLLLRIRQGVEANLELLEYRH